MPNSISIKKYIATGCNSICQQMGAMFLVLLVWILSLAQSIHFDHPDMAASSIPITAFVVSKL